jgi:hypothetical membrane protein
MALLNLAFCIAGLVALVTIFFGIPLSIRGFSGMVQDRYSLRNHFISELGDPRFAPHKTLFNASLMIGGVAFAPFIIALAMILPPVWSIIIGVNGIFCSVSAFLVGVFPEPREKLHLVVASCFFMGLAVLLLLLSIAYFLHQLTVFPGWVIVPTICALVVAAVFVVDTVSLPKWEAAITTRPWESDPVHRPNGRPAFWRNPFLEWCSIIALGVWLAIIIAICF